MAKCQLEFYDHSGGAFSRSTSGCTGTATLLVKIGEHGGHRMWSKKRKSCQFCSERLGMAGHVVGPL